MQFQSPPITPVLQESKRRFGRESQRMDSLSPLPAVPEGRKMLTKEVLLISKYKMRPPGRALTFSILSELLIRALVPYPFGELLIRIW